MKRNPEELPPAEQERLYALARAELARPLPMVWFKNTAFGHFDNADCHDNHRDGVRVIREVFMNDDGHVWMHLSVSLKGMTKIVPPPWDVMSRVKRQFVGDDRSAYQIHPPAIEHFSAYEVLHLWCPLDYRPIPDLRHATGVL